MDWALCFVAGYFWRSHLEKELGEVWRKIKAKL